MLYNPGFDNYTDLGNRISYKLEEQIGKWIEETYVDGMNPRELELIARDAVMMAFLTRRLRPSAKKETN